MVEANYGPLPPKPTNWADIFMITGELYGVSITDIEQGRVDWEYDFSSSDTRHCGRQGCKQVHGHGWIVALRDGRYVHVGNDCARKYASPDLWQAQVTGYNKRIRKEAQTKAVFQARERAQSILYWLDNNSQLRVATAIYASFVKEANGSLLSDLHKRANKGEPEVRKEVRLSDEDIMRRREALTQIRADGTTYTPHIPSVELITTGMLRGIGCFKQDVAYLARHLERDALYLLRNSHGEMTKHELDAVLNVINELGNTKRKVERAVSDISLFFTEANLKVLLSTDAARSQGVVGIAMQSDQVIFTRRAHWGKRAA